MERCYFLAAVSGRFRASQVRMKGTEHAMSELKEEAEETLDEAARGRSAQTPALVIGGVATTIAIVVAIVVAIALALYFAL
jgi:5,10-methenyltetrahydromethanopterin hydrogenase